MIILFCSTLLDLSWQNIASFATIAGIVIALIQYKKNSRVKRAETLINLYDKFYIAEHFKVVRNWLDEDEVRRWLKDNTTTLTQLETKLEEKKLEAEFGDYLNFFEFISALVELDQIHDYEALKMFRYYVDQIKTSEAVKGYLEKYKFYNLQRFLRYRNIND